MAVTIRSSTGSRVSIRKSSDTSVSRVAVAAPPVVINNINTSGSSDLIGLSDVDSSDANTNEPLVYDQETGKFIVKPLPILNGGTF